MATIRNSEFWDKRISWYIVLFFIVQSLNAMIKTVFPISEDIWSRLSLGFGLISILYLLLFCIREVVRRGGKTLSYMLVLFISLYALSIFGSYLRGDPINITLSFSALWCFSWWLPVGICAFTIKDYKILYSVFVKSSYIVFFVLLFCFLQRNNIAGSKEYNMSFGFQIVIPTLIHISEYYLKRKWYFLVLIAVELIMIFLYANRSILLCVSFFVVFLVLFGNSNYKRKFFIVTAVCALVLFFVIGGEAFLDYLVSFLDSKGISSRTITMMYEHNLDYDSGRSRIWNCCGTMIREKPFLGWGIGGEYYELSRLMGNLYNDSIIGTHNMLIQFFVEFGVILGFVLCLLVIVPVFKLHKIKDTYKFFILTVCYSATIIPCLISAAEPMQKPAMAVFLFIYYKKTKKQISRANTYQHNQPVAITQQ